MGDGWDLLTCAADVVAWMERNGFGPDRYSPPDEWTFPCLIGSCYSSPGSYGPHKWDAEPSWLIVDCAAARRLLAALPADSPGVDRGE